MVARSVSDATRFTPTTPHAGSKSSAPLSSSSSNTASESSRFSRTGPSSTPSGRPTQPPIAGETPEQRVARLRAAHQAAKRAQQSSVDTIIAKGRKFFDVAHRGAVMGLIGLTAIAGLMTIYTAADMIMYNKKRKAEFIEAQRQMEADSLEAARLAYMTGKATPEQTVLVEEVLAREAASGASSGSIFTKLPSVLGAPSPVSPPTTTTPSTSTTQEGGVADKAAAAWAEAKTTLQGQEQQQQQGQEGQKKKGWFSSRLGKAEESDDTTQRLGWERINEEDDGAGAPFSDIQRAVEDKQAYIRDKAHAALEREKERERAGGVLDRVGTEAENRSPGQAEKKKSWWSW